MFGPTLIIQGLTRLCQGVVEVVCYIQGPNTHGLAQNALTVLASHSN